MTIHPDDVAVFTKTFQAAPETCDDDEKAMAVFVITALDAARAKRLPTDMAEMVIELRKMAQEHWDSPEYVEERRLAKYQRAKNQEHYFRHAKLENQTTWKAADLIEARAAEIGRLQHEWDLVARDRAEGYAAGQFEMRQRAMMVVWKYMSQEAITAEISDLPITEEPKGGDANAGT